MQISDDNYRELLISLMERELGPSDAKAVEDYIQHTPEAQKEWKRLQATRFQPDLNITMPGKASLYRQDNEPAGVEHRHDRTQDFRIRRLSILSSRRMWAVAAVVTAFLIGFFIFWPHEEHKQVSFREEGKKENKISPASARTGNLLSKRTEKEENVIQSPSLEPAIRAYHISAHKEDPNKDGAYVKNRHKHNFKEQGTLPAPKNPIEPLETNLSMASSETQSSPSAPVPLMMKNPVRHAVKKDVAREPKSGILAFLSRSVKIKQVKQDGELYYAVSLKTQNVNISKTIKFDF